MGSLKSNSYFKYKSPPRKIENRTYRYFGDFLIGSSDDKTTRIHCRGGTFLVKKELKDKLFKLEEVIKSQNFSYQRVDHNSDNFLNYFMDKLISHGVLV